MQAIREMTHHRVVWPSSCRCPDGSDTNRKEGRRWTGPVTGWHETCPGVLDRLVQQV